MYFHKAQERHTRMITRYTSPDGLVHGSRFVTSNGADEWYFTFRSGEEDSFPKELDSLCGSYLAAMDACGLGGDTLVFSRIYLSDIENEKDALARSELFRLLGQGAVSVIEQRPVRGGSAGLLVHHVKATPGTAKERFDFDGEIHRNGVLVRGGRYRMLWIANFCGGGSFDSRIQTAKVFGAFDRILDDHGMTLPDNAVRTWVYVRDIDNNYAGMVEARKEFFEKGGLNPGTRYIASTGIEGCSNERNALVSLDACAVDPLLPGQIVRMEAVDHLPPTIRYGVTFERGTRIRFGDRSHLHISGTASIDRNGEIIHVADVRRQTERALENVRALLAPHCAGVDDMAYLIAYIRNPRDAGEVMEVLEREIPGDIPLLLVEAPVCRPAWLFEIEGVGIIPDSTEFPAFM
jgi:enamine deaminase RidA (YjgF/YER057c/UK114 family)